MTVVWRKKQNKTLRPGLKFTATVRFKWGFTRPCASLSSTHRLEAVKMGVSKRPLPLMYSYISITLNSTRALTPGSWDLPQPQQAQQPLLKATLFVILLDKSSASVVQANILMDTAPFMALYPTHLPRKEKTPQQENNDLHFWVVCCLRHA